MATLSKRDSERLLRFVAEANAVDGDEPFTPEVLVELGRLVGADWIAYSELDSVRTVLLVEIERAGDKCSIPFPDPYSNEIADINPIRVRHARGYAGALKVSDFMSRSELRRSRLYECFRLYGVEHSMELRLPHPAWRPRTFHFDRFGGRDFSERDRLVLDTLRPHLTALEHAARTRRLLRAALTQIDHPRPRESGVMLLDGAGAIEFASRDATRLLSEFFTERPRSRLPRDLEHWVRSGSVEPFRRRRDGRFLVAERDGQALLLRAEQDDVRLTNREQEVLRLVAQGKTNTEIATCLWLAPSTVRKHLQNVYAKLGVRTRGAAVARLHGLIYPEAS